MTRYLPDGRKAYRPSRTMRDIHDEWEALETMCIAWGDDPMAAFFHAREIWRREEAAGERWKEWQQRVWYPRQRANAPPSKELTADEWRYLADVLEGANHPLAQSIQQKAMRHQ